MSVVRDISRGSDGEAGQPLSPSPAAGVARFISPRRGRPRRWATHINGWLLLLPAAIMLAVFTHSPPVATLIDSFSSTPNRVRPGAFVGLAHYQATSEDSIFWRARNNNIIYALATIPLTIALSMTMAVVVNGKIQGRAFMRLSFFTPTVLPMIAVANIWLFFYSPGYGLIDQVLGLFGVPDRK